jgi:multimeric flavodoxin WrbA
MKFAIINGSPKSEKNSVTMSFIHYIQKMYPQHEFEIINVGSKLIKMKISEKIFNQIIDQIKNSDGILWSFPVYTMLIPAQLKKFIELIWERNVEDVFQGKYAGVLSTSMYFFDHTAHNYMHAIIDDLNMKYIGFQSMTLDDILSAEKRKNFYHFFEHFIFSIENGIPVSKRYPPLIKSDFKYNPGEPATKISSEGRKIKILTDYTDPESNMAKMINHFKDTYTDKTDVEVINLHDINMKGSCLGCIRCGFENKCVYNDGYIDFFNKSIRNQEIFVFAAEIRDRYYSSLWKQFFDRMFFNGHRPAMFDTQICFIVSGSLRQIPNLRQLISALAECGEANLVDVVSDEYEDSKQIDQLLENMAAMAIRYRKMNYIRPTTFLEVGGFKVFRDLIYGLGKMTFPSDYKFFKKHKMFDFPNKDRKMMLFINTMALLLKSKKIRKIFSRKILELMLFPANRFLGKMKIEEELKNLNK